MAGRGRREIEGLIGFFVNTLALRVDLSGAPTVAELLGRVRARALEAQQHQDIPFEQVVERVRPGAQPGAQPALPGDVRLAERAPRDGWRSRGWRWSRVRAGPRACTAKFDLSLTLCEADGGSRGGVTYAAALFDAATVERWRGLPAAGAGEMVADEQRRVERLALMPEGSARWWWTAWNRTDAAYPGGVAMHAPSRRRRRACRTRWRWFAGAVAHLRGAERAGEPAGAPPPVACGVGPGGAGGAVHGAQPGDWWRGAGHPQVRRRVRPLDPGTPRAPGEMLADSDPAAGAGEGSVLANRRDGPTRLRGPVRRTRRAGVVDAPETNRSAAG